MDISLEKGVFILSLDLELAWGSAHGDSLSQRISLFQETRKHVNELINILETYQIHATWAVVGHLFLEHCQYNDSIKHPDIIRPKYPWYPEDWYSVDPCSNIEEDPIWYGADIIQQILNSKTHQEIGCHTFSHVIAGEQGCTADSLLSEIRACQAEAEKLGISLESFVFPKNSVGHLDILKQTGFSVYRGVSPALSSRYSGLAGRLIRLINSFSPFSPPVVVPQWHDNIWNLPASHFYPVTNKWVRLFSGDMTTRKSLAAIKKAKNNRKIFHLWFHPFNLASNPEQLLEGLDTIFSTVARYRDEGMMDNFTMGDMVQHLQTRNISNPSLESQF